jgi:hypothetical protein
MQKKLTGWGNYDKGKPPREPKKKAPPKPKIIKGSKYGKVK